MPLENPEEVIRQLKEDYEKAPDIMLDGATLPEKARLGDLFWNTDDRELYICAGRIDGNCIWRKITGRI